MTLFWRSGHFRTSMYGDVHWVEGHWVERGDWYRGPGYGTSKAPESYLLAADVALARDRACWPTKCPRCGDPVFFVRHNGGSVWFDELGWPWPKHTCFDDDFTFRPRVSSLAPPEGSRYSIGVIMEVQPLDYPGHAIVIDCGVEGDIRGFIRSALHDLEALNGAVALVRQERQDSATATLYVSTADSVELSEAEFLLFGKGWA